LVYREFIREKTCLACNTETQVKEVFGLVFGQVLGCPFCGCHQIPYKACGREKIKIYMCHRFPMLNFSLFTNTFISTRCCV